MQEADIIPKSSYEEGNGVVRKATWQNHQFTGHAARCRQRVHVMWWPRNRLTRSHRHFRVISQPVVGPIHQTSVHNKNEIDLTARAQRWCASVLTSLEPGYYCLWRMTRIISDLPLPLQAAEHHRFLGNTKLYCLLTEARVCVCVHQSPRIAARNHGNQKSNLRPVDHKSTPAS